MDIKKVVEVKESGKWKQTYVDTDAGSVYESLAHDLISKKICSCAYIKSIKRSNNFDGTQTIVVNYDNGVRATYTVKD